MIVLHSHYCHRSALYREYKRQTGSTLSEKSFNRYLVRWQKEGEIYSAGRNWYSDLQDEFKLFTRPLTELNDFLAEAFPLLEFVCWSTKQLTNFYHNLPGKFYTFIYVSRYSMREVAEHLHKKYPESSVLLNPGKNDLLNFSPRNSNIVIRPLIYDDSQSADSFLQIENILVDLAIEAEALSLMDETEYSCILNDAAVSGRIKPGVILRRLARRKVKSGYIDALLKYFQVEQ